MIRFAEILEERHEDFARIAAEEMGKPVFFGKLETLKCAEAARYYAENAERIVAD
jgi:succinate-semialdehyde dehydrogenase/glutarate-semialdehyde dehydrogenase